MLFDPLEEEFDLPAILVELGDVYRRCLQIVGRQHQWPVLALALNDDFAQWIGIGVASPSARTGVVEADDTILQHDALIVLGNGQRSLHAQAGIALKAGDEARPLSVNPRPPVVVAIPFVKDIGGATLDFQRTAFINVIHVGGTEAVMNRRLLVGGVQQVQLDTLSMASPVALGPWVKPMSLQGD
ncbi:MAG TPA: hypothetical protein VFW68_05855 [Rhodocyclaceae bacterium]|nr:hypothetical protein [Rhodocyclaceae bacterium]